jgi:hypothetical protein
LGPVAFAFRAQVRSRWKSWLLIAVLVTVVGGFVLAASAAGWRTDAALPHFVATHGYDATVYTAADTAMPPRSALPEVTAITRVLGVDSGVPRCDCSRPLNPTEFSVIAPAGGPQVWNLVAGHEPDPSDPYQVVASAYLEQAAGVHIGTVIHVPLYAASQTQAYNNASGAYPAPTGPTVAFHVVGLEASELDLPYGATPSYEVFTSRAFTKEVAPKAASGVVFLVRLRHGDTDLLRFNSQMNALTKGSIQGIGSEDEEVASVESAIHPQAIGWWILAALAGLVGLAVVGQALARQSNVEAEEYPTLAALGTDRRQLFRLAMARTVVVGVVGAAGALVLAFLLSPMAPEGEARLVETSTGVTFDAHALLLGALATLVVVVALGIWPSVRAARLTRPDDRAAFTHPSATVARLAAVGAPPSALIGVRNALESKTGGANVPVGTALMGTVLAVTALCGTLVFGTSLTHLTTTPVLYGEGYQLNFTVSPGMPNRALEASLIHNRAVTGLTRGLANPVSVGGTTLGAIAAQSIRGPLDFSVVSGTLPDGDGQVGLGTSTLRQLHAHVGSVVGMTVFTPSGGKRTEPFRVVSAVAFPVLGGEVGLGTGALFTIPGYLAAVCPAGSGRTRCQQEVLDTSDGGILATVLAGPEGRAAVTHYLDSFRSIAALPAAPTSLINFGEAVNFPLIFGCLLAVFGAATLAHLMVVSVSRRSREIGLLKVLGFVNGQVVAAVGWQATTVALVGIVIGIPLGIIAGRGTWHAFASHLGVIPVSVVPVGLVGVLVVGVIVVANLLALGPAIVAARSKPGRLLRVQ